MKTPFKRLAISTGGGDAPGLNAVIRSVVLSASNLGWEVLGIDCGYNGLIGELNVTPLTRESVKGIHALGGTILGTTNRGNPFEYVTRRDDGTVEIEDRSQEVVDNLRHLEVDCLISIGGDGSMAIAQKFVDLGVQVIGVPKTIDNDLNGTVVTFGFQTAVEVATDAIDRLHSTAEAHDRVFIVEVMGRYAGWIALHSGLAGGADAILIPEIPYDTQAVADAILARQRRGREFSIVVAAEGARERGGEAHHQTEASAGENARLGGIAEHLTTELAQRTGKETRSVVLGHLQRGGRPNAYDRLIALRFGAAAVRLAAAGRSNIMVALDPPDVLAVPLSVATQRMKCVPLDGDTLATARQMGISLGEPQESEA